MYAFSIFTRVIAFYIPTQTNEEPNKFAISQNKKIQRAIRTENEKDTKWRLELLDATSKYVDRQLAWDNSVIADAMEAIDVGAMEESTGDEYVHENDNAVDEALLVSIPQEIGYSKREDSQVDVNDAFSNSKSVNITSLGKQIVDGILYINREQSDRGGKEVFKYTGKTVPFLIYLGNGVCRNEEDFGCIIDNLYFLIYENLERIKDYIGKGNNKEGDSKIRSEAVYDCVFRIKDIRSDLRHDLEHGDKNKIEKKQQDVNDAYKHYSHKRPRKEKEFKDFQFNLYNDVVALINHLQDIYEEGDEL